MGSASLSDGPPPYPSTPYRGDRSAPRPPLAGDRQVDIAIIGAGLTGLGAALTLAESGVSVLVLEAARVGWGASGRNGGQLLPGLSADLAAVERQYGYDMAQALFDLSVEAVASVKQRIARHAIACDFMAGHVTAALRPRQMAHLAAEQALWARYGYGGLELWPAEQLRAVVRSPLYCGGLYDANAGHLDPLAYCLALARLAEAAGAVIHEASPVEHVALPPGGGVRLTTPGGQVGAERLLVCGNAYLGALLPRLQREIMPVASCIGATPPLGQQGMAALLTRPIAVADANFVLDYFRPTADHRLLFGGRAAYDGRPPRDIAAALAPRLARVFPQLGRAPFEQSWAGLIAITRDRLPRLGRLGQNAFYAHGYSGHGLALSGLAGTILAELCLGRPEKMEIFDRLPHRPFPGGVLRTPLLVLAMLYYRLRDLV